MHYFSRMALLLQLIRQSFITQYLRNVFFLFCINTQQQIQVEIVDKKAVGVCYQTNGKEHMVKVEKEVIVSAGTVASPQVCKRL